MPRWVVPAICLALVAMTWAVFGQTLSYPFVNYDDGTYVYSNPVICGGLSLRNIAWAFTHIHSQNWHPLTTLSHMLDVQLFGLNAGRHHFVNVNLHTAGVLMLFLVLRTLTGATWRSAFVAALFAIHPLHVESVAWIAERKDVLSGLFFMLTIGAYARYARSEARILWYAVIAIMLSLGLMSKPMLVSTPIILLLLDYWPLGRLTDWRTFRKLIVEKLPLLLLVAGSCVATVLAQREATGSAAELPLSWRLQNAAASYVLYIGQMFWPTRLAVFYPHSENTLPLWWVGLSVSLLFGMTLLAFLTRQRHPYILTGWLWYVVMLVPVIGIFQVGLHGHADRYTYLPQIGLSIMVTWAAVELVKGSRLRLVGLTSVAIIALMALGLIAWRQVTYWKDSETLWTRALAVTPNNDVALAGLGGVLLEAGKVDDAIAHLRSALRIRPDNPEGHSALADALMRSGQTQEAASHWEKTVALQPEGVQARDKLGALLVQQGRLSDGLAQWRESLKYDRDDANALSNIAWVLAAAPDSATRDGAQAVALARRASRMAGDMNPLILRTLAAAYAEAGDFSSAIETAARGADYATKQHNAFLADELRRNMTLYEEKTPLHDPSLRNSPSSP